MKVYVIDTMGLESGSIVLRAPARRLELICDAGCQNHVSEGYLALECDHQLKAGAVAASGALRSKSELLQGQLATSFSIHLDTSGLTVGTSYRLCTDLDGITTNQGAGDSGMHVMIGGPCTFPLESSDPACGHDGWGGSAKSLSLWAPMCNAVSEKHFSTAF